MVTKEEEDLVEDLMRMAEELCAHVNEHAGGDDLMVVDLLDDLSVAGLRLVVDPNGVSTQAYLRWRRRNRTKVED